MRIRSIHPEQWQDGDFCALTFDARLLVLGLRNLADDHGLFPWRPDHIKAAIFPHDSLNLDDVESLLKQASALNQIVRYTVDDCEYGIIRNFTKYQSPRKPNYKYPLPEIELGKGYKPVPNHYRTGTVPVPNQCGTSTVPVRHGEGEGNGIGEGEGYGNGVREDIRANKDLDKDKISRAVDPETEAAMRDLMNAWNAMAATCGLSQVQRLTDGRKRNLSARFKDKYFREFWRDALASIPESDFLCGRVKDARWTCDLDWFLKPDNIVKVVEKKYHKHRDLTGQHVGDETVPF